MSERDREAEVRRGSVRKIHFMGRVTENFPALEVPELYPFVLLVCYRKSKALRSEEGKGLRSGLC
jgi:hypothetical protein